MECSRKTGLHICSELTLPEERSAYLLGSRLARWQRLLSASMSCESCCSCSQWRVLSGPLRGASSFTMMGNSLPIACRASNSSFCMATGQYQLLHPVSSS